MILLVSASLRAQGAELSHTNKQYDAGDYSGAAAGYKELLVQTPNDPGLHYNLGNCLFKSGQIGRAIASYQRAFDLRPRDGDVRYNLEFALKKSGEELIPASVPPVLFSVFYLLSERELAGLHWLFWWALLALASLYLYREPLRGALTLWCVWAACLWLFAGGWWLARRSLEPEERGVIIRSTAEIRSGPGTNFNVSLTAPEGRRISILAEQGEWLEIGLLKEGAKGWVPAESVEKI